MRIEPGANGSELSTRQAPLENIAGHNRNLRFGLSEHGMPMRRQMVLEVDHDPDAFDNGDRRHQSAGGSARASWIKSQFSRKPGWLLNQPFGIRAPSLPAGGIPFLGTM